MSYFFWPTPRWFTGALCCRYLVVHFGKLRVLVLDDGATAGRDWHWALGLFRDGSCQVLGAWRDDGAGTAQRIATDLYDRGIERIRAVAAEEDLVDALATLQPKVGRRTSAELAESKAVGPRMRRAIQWSEAATRHLQDRMTRATRRQGPFADQAAAADFIAQAFQRADRDLFHDTWDRKQPALYGPGAAAAALARAA